MGSRTHYCCRLSDATSLKEVWRMRLATALLQDTRRIRHECGATCITYPGRSRSSPSPRVQRSRGLTAVQANRCRGEKSDLFPERWGAFSVALTALRVTHAPPLRSDNSMSFIIYRILNHQSTRISIVDAVSLLILVTRSIKIRSAATANARNWSAMECCSDGDGRGRR